MTSKIAPVARRSELVVQQLRGELLIYDLKINKAFCLNETSALVWQMCDGNNSIGDISRKLSKKLKSLVTEDFVWLAIDELQEDNLLDESHKIETNFEGLSRREILRKVGFASMIALPVISSLVAPTAAMAQSAGACVSQQGICTTSAQCCSSAPRCINYGGIRRCCIGVTGGVPSGTVLSGSAFVTCDACRAALGPDCCSKSANNFTCTANPFFGFDCSGTCT